MKLFPCVIECLSPHGLEHSAQEGVDYCRFRLIKNEEELQQHMGKEIRIIANQVWGECGPL